ncbi:unnamed protein product [Aureobasidium mustum]|uniref:Carbohydrate-binding-like protein n=1 Tax=Aureobasidium mustum TaxID=2773714 RepID=A0A9N8JKY2_9PEZI|nr:unnamed protein product [Aureobasidium mustum]
MRYSALALPAIVANLAAALPRPQEIDLDMVIAAPDPTYTQIPGSSVQIVTYDTSAILAEATAAASSISIAATNVATATSVANVKRNACDTQAAGVYTYQTDSASAFRADPRWASMASNAPVPTGFVQTQTNANGANSAYGYLGYHNLDSYDVNACADFCTHTLGCMAFNVYVQRDASLEPAAACPSPSSVIYARCALWGSPLSSDSATNTGPMREQFEVVVAGSNAYQNNTLVVPAGFGMNDALGDAALTAPYDGQGYNTFMGSTIFTKGTFSIQACADYCSAQTAYNVKHPASDGSPPRICASFNTYMLYLNNASTPQGQYCTLYTEVWNSSYATNKGQYRGSDHYFVAYSFTFKNSTSVAPAPGQGDVQGAIYQARQDMTYYPSQLTSTFEPYCSSLLAYSTAVTTVTPTSTITPIATATAVVTQTADAQKVKRDGVENVPTSILLPWFVVSAAAVSLDKRATPTPAVLTKYPVAVQSGACSLIATQPTGVSTVTAAVVTITAAQQTSTSTSTTIVAAATAAAPSAGLIQVQNSSSPYNNLYALFVAPTITPGTPLKLTSDISQAANFSLASDHRLLYGDDRELISNPVEYQGLGLPYSILALVPVGLYPAGYPRPAVSVAVNGTLSIRGTGVGDVRTVLQVCADIQTTTGTGIYGSGPFFAFDTKLWPGCEVAEIAFV